MAGGACRCRGERESLVVFIPSAASHASQRVKGVSPSNTCVGEMREDHTFKHVHYETTEIVDKETPPKRRGEGTCNGGRQTQREKEREKAERGKRDGINSPVLQQESSKRGLD